MSIELKAFNRDQSEGYYISHETVLPNATATLDAYVATKVGHEGIAVPYTFVLLSKKEGEIRYGELTADQNKAVKELLTILSESDVECSEWAREVLSHYGKLDACYNLANGSGFDYTFKDNEKYKTIHIEPCGYDPKNCEFFDVTDDVIESDSSLWKIAEQIVNSDGIQKSFEVQRNNLQDYFEKNILPYRNTPYEMLTQEQKENFDQYSDMHKDMFGIRPRLDRDMCYQAYCDAKKENKMKIDMER